MSKPIRKTAADGKTLGLRKAFGLLHHYKAYAPANSSRGGCGSDEMLDALGEKRPDEESVSTGEEAVK